MAKTSALPGNCTKQKLETDEINPEHGICDRGQAEEIETEIDESIQDN